MRLTSRGASSMSQHKKTVAIFADGGFLAHVTRSYEVGRALARCFGHRVVFCGAGPYMHIPLDAGFEVRPVYTVDREMTMKLAKRAGLCSLSWWRNECERSVRSDLEVLGQIDPDLVVGDMHWSLCTSARVLEIPYVAITNAAWTRWYAEPIEPPAGHFSTKILGQRLCRKLFPKIKDALTWYYSLGYTEIRKRYGMAPVRSIFDLIEGDMTLLADVPEFMPTVDALPESFRYVGPILWDADLPEPAWLERLDPSRPTLYFTMGSTGDAQFFNEAIRVFGDTVYQALSCRVPLIGFPSIFDQEINMQRVCALGAGIRMWRSEYDAEALKEAVDHVLGDLTYRASCQRLERRIAYMDGPRRAALHIDHLLRSGSPAYQPDDVTNAIRLLPELDAA